MYCIFVPFIQHQIFIFATTVLINATNNANKLTGSRRWLDFITIDQQATKMPFTVFVQLAYQHLRPLRLMK